MDWTAWIGWGTLALIPAFLALDLVHRAKNYKRPRWYRLRGLLMAVAVIGGSFGLASVWEQVLVFPTLFDLSAMNVFAALGITILVYEFFHYWYHRAAHRFNWLWLGAHQTHHSTESHDAFGANYTSPLDFVIFGSLPILVAVPLLGVSPLAGAMFGAWITFNAMFQHANMRTPRWLGYIIERPESHSLHHATGVHKYNYSDLPLWDMVFGTFRNPRYFADEVGFYQGASARVPEMFAFKDVSKQPRNDDEKTTRILPTTSIIEAQQAA